MSKLFIGNIDWNVTDQELQELFAQYGEVTEAVIIKDRDTGRPKGFGFVTFAEAANADTARTELDGYELGGRPLAVNEARPRD